MRNHFKYIYGPVYSWRLGVSLGIDPISSKSKVCNFDCVYCQLGKTARFFKERKDYVQTKDIIHEINLLPSMDIDFLTFSGRGEPTLAKNLGEMIEALRKTRKEKIAVITNSSLLFRADVQRDCALADYVLAKLDACSQASFMSIDQAMKSIRFETIINGIEAFRCFYQGKLALQIMFIEENKKYAQEIADIARKINPDEIQLNTPTRSNVTKVLSKQEMEEIKDHFKGMSVLSVFDSSRIEVQPINERDTIQRHGNYKIEN